MIKRTLFAIPALALLVSAVYFGGLFAKITIAAAGMLLMHEMLKAVSERSRPFKFLGYSFAVLLYPAYEFAGGFTGVAMLFVLLVAAVFAMFVIFGRDAHDGFMTAFALAYPGMFYAFLIAITCIADINAYRFLMIIAFGSAVVTDSFAYFTGMLIGRHKLAESISPKKTVEGAAGGALFGTAAVVIFGYFGQSAFGINMPVYLYLIFGVALTVLAQLGDLAASKIKRYYGLKDFGRIMGAHGGAMDRLDSMLFVAPAVYAFYSIMA